MEEEEAQVGAVMDLWDYDRPLETVLSFKYLGRLLTSTDDEWIDAIANPWKSRKSQSLLDRILGQEGVDTWTSGRFYVAVI